MRSLVFLPPLSLAHFPGACTRSHFHWGKKSEVEEVPDSVDPLPALSLVEEDEESVAVSVVEGAREQVPWEELHPLEARGNEDELKGVADGRVGPKRVRIESPVLVIETPERNKPPLHIQKDRIQQHDGCTRTNEAGSGEGADEADKSRVIVGDDTLPEDCEEGGTTEQLDRSMLAALPAISIPVPHREASFAPEHTGRYGEQLSSRETGEEESSLQIRAPVPAAAPATTCRFTFFNKQPRPHPRPSIVATDPSVPSITIDQPSSIGAHSQAREAGGGEGEGVCLRNVRPPLVGAGDNSSLHATLPSMNAVGASLGLLSFPSSSSCLSMGGHSILPPPTLHFSLSAVTPIALILANPSHFLPHSSSVVKPLYNPPGAASSRVNLLVVIKDVGEVSRVRTKMPINAPTRDGNRGVTRAFTEALGDGKTERVELVVMDGRMSSVRRLVETESGGSDFTLVDEAVEKSLFKVVLWGSLARSWTSTDLEQHSPTTTTTTPTQLRAGDVVHLSNLSLSRTPTAHAEYRRLGPGFPRPEKVTLVAHANPSNHASVELCFRSSPLTAQDRERNFDPHLPNFDLKSRRVAELSRLWHT